MPNDSTLLKMALDSATQVLSNAAASGQNPSQTALPEYVEALYKKLKELNSNS
ncbi:hypothetical protein [Veillonella magna]|uniref:Uncharacterized protein n=1 Tax=Veillonella magna TaxID=464322 RepID=A0ABS2GIU3_9FIRM|nr:hypothetical protein [Veillonella magna]MBM6824822.1 hypothetical protein [Veillonella magna]MBM6913099.1 hypothetical protein [Veillonella magna]